MDSTTLITLFILRTADATQVTGVIILSIVLWGNTCRCQDINRGSGTYFPLPEGPILAKLLINLKKQASGYLEQIWMAPHLINGTQLERLPLSLVMKARESLLTSRNKWDEMITIPMSGHVQSFNASVAAAVLMYEVYRNRL